MKDVSWSRGLPVLGQMVNVWKDWSQKGFTGMKGQRCKGRNARSMMTVRYYLIDCKYSQQQTFMESLACVWRIELSAGIQRLEMRKMREILLNWIAEKREKDQLPYLCGSWGNLYKDHLVCCIWTTYLNWSWTESNKASLWFSYGIGMEEDIKNDRGKYIDSKIKE